MHLTGMRSTNGLSANQFYNKCLQNKLSSGDFEFATDGVNHLKLSILPELICKNMKATMIGDYDSQNPNLNTEMLVGNIRVYIGFVQGRRTYEYIPNAVLKEDISDITRKRRAQVIVICRKNQKERMYVEVTYRAKMVPRATLWNMLRAYSQPRSAMISLGSEKMGIAGGYIVYFSPEYGPPQCGSRRICDGICSWAGVRHTCAPLCPLPRTRGTDPRHRMYGPTAEPPMRIAPFWKSNSASCASTTGSSIDCWMLFPLSSQKCIGCQPVEYFRCYHPLVLLYKLQGYSHFALLTLVICTRWRRRHILFCKKCVCLPTST